MTVSVIGSIQYTGQSGIAHAVPIPGTNAFAILTRLSGNSEVYIVDTTDPTSLVEIGTTSLATSFAFQGAARNDKLIVHDPTTADALIKVDVSDPSSPFEVGRTSNAVLATGTSTQNLIWLDDQYLAVSAGGGLSIWDTNPNNPSLTATIPTPQSDEGIGLFDDRYLVAWQNNGGMTVADVIDPTAPSVIFSTTDFVAFTSNGHRTVQVDDRFMVAFRTSTSQVLRVLDMQTPSAPTLDIGGVFYTFDLGKSGANLTEHLLSQNISGEKILYLANTGADDITVVNVDDPLAMALDSSDPVDPGLGGPLSVDQRAGVLFTMDGDTFKAIGLGVGATGPAESGWDMPRGPIGRDQNDWDPFSGAPDPRVSIYGDCCDATVPIQCVDDSISFTGSTDDPALTSSLGLANTLSALDDIKHVIVYEGGANLTLWDVSGSSPVRRGTVNVGTVDNQRIFPLPGGTHAVAASNSGAAVQGRLLRTIDCSNVNAPTIDGVLDLSLHISAGTFLGAAVCGDYFVAKNSDRCVVIDCSDPTSPTFVTETAASFFAIDSTFYNCAGAPGVFCGTTRSGLNIMEVVDVSNPASPVLASTVGNPALAGFTGNLCSYIRSGVYWMLADTANDALLISADVSDPYNAVFVDQREDLGNTDGAVGLVPTESHCYVAVVTDNGVVPFTHNGGDSLQDQTRFQTGSMIGVDDVAVQAGRLIGVSDLGTEIAIYHNVGCQPTDLWSFNAIGGSANDIAWSPIRGDGSTVFVTSRLDPNRFVASYDMSGASPVQLDTVTLPNASRNITRLGNYVYVGTTTGIAIVDATNPSAMSLTDEIASSPAYSGAQVLDATYALVGYDPGTRLVVRTYDVSDVNNINPAFSQEVTIFGSSGQINTPPFKLSNDWAVISWSTVGADSYVAVIDISNPASISLAYTHTIVEAGTAARPVAFIYDPTRDLLFVTGLGGTENGLYVYDVSAGLDSPWVLIRKLVDPDYLSSPRGMSLDDDGVTLYVADSVADGIIVVDTSTPASTAVVEWIGDASAPGGGGTLNQINHVLTLDDGKLAATTQTSTVLLAPLGAVVSSCPDYTIPPGTQTSLVPIVGNAIELFPVVFDSDGATQGTAIGGPPYWSRIDEQDGTLVTLQDDDARVEVLGSVANELANAPFGGKRALFVEIYSRVLNNVDDSVSSGVFGIYNGSSVTNEIVPSNATTFALRLGNAASAANYIMLAEPLTSIGGEIFCNKVSQVMGGDGTIHEVDYIGVYLAQGAGRATWVPGTDPVNYPDLDYTLAQVEGDGQWIDIPRGTTNEFASYKISPLPIDALSASGVVLTVTLRATGEGLGPISARILSKDRLIAAADDLGTHQSLVTECPLEFCRRTIVFDWVNPEATSTDLQNAVVELSWTGIFGISLQLDFIATGSVYVSFDDGSPCFDGVLDPFDSETDGEPNLLGTPVGSCITTNGYGVTALSGGGGPPLRSVSLFDPADYVNHALAVAPDSFSGITALSGDRVLILNYATDGGDRVVNGVIVDFSDRSTPVVGAEVELLRVTGSASGALKMEAIAVDGDVVFVTTYLGSAIGRILLLVDASGASPAYLDDLVWPYFNWAFAGVTSGSLDTGGGGMEVFDSAAQRVVIGGAGLAIMENSGGSIALVGQTTDGTNGPFSPVRPPGTNRVWGFSGTDIVEWNVIDPANPVFVARHNEGFGAGVRSMTICNDQLIAAEWGNTAQLRLYPGPSPLDPEVDIYGWPNATERDKINGVDSFHYRYGRLYASDDGDNSYLVWAMADCVVCDSTNSDHLQLASVRPQFAQFINGRLIVTSNFDPDLHVINISTPLSLVRTTGLTGSYEGPLIPTSNANLWISKPVYNGSSPALNVIDLTTPDSVSVDASYPSANNNYAGDGDWAEFTNVVVTLGRDTLGSDTRLVLWDHSTPTAVSITTWADVAFADARWNITPLVRNGNYLYFVDDDVAEAMFVIDMTTPTSPSLVTTWANAFIDQAISTVVYGVVIDASHIALGRSDGDIMIVNVSTPGSPSQAAIISGAGEPHEVVNGILITATGLYDVSTPSSPVLRSSEPFGTSYLLREGDLVWFHTGSEGGVRMVDISNPDNPREEARVVDIAHISPSSFGPPQSIYRDGEYIFVPSGDKGGFPPNGDFISSYEFDPACLPSSPP